MKILKYKKGKRNEYQILTDEKEYTLYDDIIIKHELLLKKEITKKELRSTCRIVTPYEPHVEMKLPEWEEFAS